MSQVGVSMSIQNSSRNYISKFKLKIVTVNNLEVNVFGGSSQVQITNIDPASTLDNFDGVAKYSIAFYGATSLLNFSNSRETTGKLFYLTYTSPDGLD